MASASTDRPSKLQKVARLRRSLPHLTASALSEVCKTMRSEGVPDLTQRKHIAEAARASLRDTGHGPIVEHMELTQSNGAQLRVPSVNFWALLQQAILEADSSYARHFWAQVLAHPPGPDNAWRLVLYCDEIVPGNPLAVQTKRKIWACYGSFLEMGAHTLQHEQAWLCLGLLRSNLVNKAESGVSQWISCILPTIFQRPAYDLRHGAVPLQQPNGGVLLFRLDLSMIVQDGAHKFLWSCKGDAGTRMCMLCRNVLAQRCDILESSGLPLCGSSEIREERLLLSSDESIYEAMDKLVRKKTELTAGDFQLWQQSTGWNYQPRSILQQQDQRWLVRPVSQYCHDSMHALLVSGVFQTVVWLLLSTLQRQFPNIWEIANRYVEKWTLPAVTKHTARGLLDEGRAKVCRENEAFKCTASEGLTLSPLLAAFLRQLVRAQSDVEAISEVRCFLQLDKLVACCQRARAEDAVAPAEMRTRVRGFLTCVIAANWQSSMHAKFHWLLHFAGHLAKWRFMVQCFTHERKHKTIKKFASDFYNTRSFEDGMLREVLAQELHDLALADCLEPGLRLLDPKPCARKTADAIRTCLPELTAARVVHTAAAVRLWSGERISRGDVVLLQGAGALQCGQVWALVSLPRGPHGLLHSVSDVSHDGDQGECRLVESLELVPCSEFLGSCCWRDIASARRLVLLPASLR